MEASLLYSASPYLRITRNRMWSQHLRSRGDLCEFETNLAYIESSKTKTVKNIRDWLEN